MKKTFTLLMSLIFVSTMIFGQKIAKPISKSGSQSQNSSSISQKRKCGTMENLQRQIQNDPQVETQMQNLETYTQQWIENNPNYAQNKAGEITIPVVVHIVYKANAENIADARVTEQITILNRDYAGLNTHSMGSFTANLKTDTKLRFCLAQRKPDGTATNGIERKLTTVTSFTDDAVKNSSQGGLDAWDPTKYINIWVCNLGGGLCGYAQFPYTGTNSNVNSTFGVVIQYQFFGLTNDANYNLGGTTTHEIGHCFNLAHIWGDRDDCVQTAVFNGSDGCTDTPNQAAATYGVNSGVVTDACATSSPGIQYMNFMDYSDDASLANFTPNQAARIMACFALGGPLYSLTTSNGCTPSGGAIAPVAAYSYSPSSVSIGSTIQFTDASTNTPTSWNWTISPSSYSFTGGTSATSQNPKIIFNAATSYTVTLRATNTTGFDDEIKTITVSAASTTCDTVFYPLTATPWYSYSNGTNNYHDKVKANYISNVTSGSTLSEVYVDFILAKGTTGTATVAVYNGATGSPGSILTSKVLTLNSIKTDITNNVLTRVQFTTPITLTGPIFVGVILPTTYASGDTVVVSADTSASMTNVAWEQFNNDTWFPYTDASSWKKHAHLAIFPIICPATVGVETTNNLDLVNIFPNPTSGEINISFGNEVSGSAIVSIYNNLGSLIYENKYSETTNKVSTISLNNVESGIYYVTIQNNQQVVTKRVSIIK